LVLLNSSGAVVVEGTVAAAGAVVVVAGILAAAGIVTAVGRVATEEIVIASETPMCWCCSFFHNSNMLFNRPVVRQSLAL
jgi:hypothetical protein